MNTINISQEAKQYLSDVVLHSKQSIPQLSLADSNIKNRVLLRVADLLEQSRNQIKEINALDIAFAKESNLSPAMLDRLLLSDKVINSMIKATVDIAKLKDPIGEVISGWTTERGLKIQKKRIPIGTLLVIYESRPNITIEIAALCLKSSNTVILRSGREALHSSQYLTTLFQEAITDEQLPKNIVQCINDPNRAFIQYLLQCNKYIDLVIPRGGEALINFVCQNSTIPVVKHDKGVCHTYIHSSAKKEDAINIVLNAKTQRTGVCNTLESLLIDKNCPFLDDILIALQNAEVTLHGDLTTQQSLHKYPIVDLYETGYGTEYLSMDISIKLVDTVHDAIEHIRSYSSSHSEAIIAEDYSVIQIFLNSLDSAALFINASTRFHDGGEFGLGAELGIATGKLHSRGPMGLSDLTSYQYIVHGNGHTRV